MLCANALGDDPIRIDGLLRDREPTRRCAPVVATEADTLYALNADNGSLLWSRSFLVANPALTAGGKTVTVTTVSNSDVNTRDINPQIGITSTSRT